MIGKYLMAVMVAMLLADLGPLVLKSVDSNASKAFHNKRVLVTGCSTGIGRAMVLEYAKAGARILAVARTESKLKDLVEECKALGATDAQYIAADLSGTDDGHYEKIIQQASELLKGPLDVLVLNHITDLGSVFSKDFWVESNMMAKLRKIFDANAFSYISLANAALSNLAKTKGQIIVNSSALGVLPQRRGIAYSGAKHALHGIFNSLQEDLNGAGKPYSDISVSISIIGAILTQHSKETIPNLPDFLWASPESCAESLIRQSTLRRKYLYFPFSQSYLTMKFSSMFPDSISFFMNSVQELGSHPLF